MMTERERFLQDEINRLHSERKREDDSRWEEVQKHLSQIPSIKKTVEALDKSVNGEPDSPEKGFKIRLDRLEQKQKLGDWVIRTLGVATLGTVIHAVWQRLKGG